MTGFIHRFRPVYVLWITVMWMFLMGEASVANLVGGLLVGLGVTLLLPLPAMPVAGVHVSWGKLVLFLLGWVVDFTHASVKVAWLAIRPAEPPRTAIVDVPMRVDSEFALTVAVVLYNLQPGGAVTDIDIAERMLTVHLLDASNIEEEIASVAKLERSLIDIFERTV